MIPRSFLFAAALSAVLFSGAVTSAQVEAYAGRPIRRVDVETRNVFEGGESGAPGWQRWADGLHITTRSVVIERELLFKAGDQLDPELIAESERNLRDLIFLHDLEITVVAAGPDSVDIRVISRDQFSLVPSLVLTSGGGLTHVGGGLEEVNFLGRGKQLWIEAVHETDVGVTWSGGYSDPQVLGSHLVGGFFGETGPLIQAIGGHFSKPFHKSDTPWSWGLWGGLEEETRRLFEGGGEVSRFLRNSDEIGIYASRSLGERYRKWRFTVGYDYQLKTYYEIEGTTLPLAEDELTHTTSLTISRERHSFTVERWINKFGRKEDITLGNDSALIISRCGFPVNKGVKRWELDIYHDQKWRLSDRHYLFAELGFTTKFERDTIFSFQTRWYRILSRMTLALNIEGKFSNDLDVSRQFALGGDSGLRGYPAREFTGDKLLLANLEDRIFPDIEVFTLAIGGVAFVDAGHVWDRDESIDLSELNASAGFGLRLGVTRAPTAPISRIDVGWPLTRRGGPALTLGIEQHF